MRYVRHVSAYLRVSACGRVSVHRRMSAYLRVSAYGRASVHRRAGAYGGPTESRGELMTGGAAVDGLQPVLACLIPGGSAGNRWGQAPARS